MHLFWDEDMYEPVSEHRPCTACGGDLRKCNGGCNGMSSFGWRVRSPEEVAKIKADRLKKQEDDILAQADAIRARRSV